MRDLTEKTFLLNSGDERMLNAVLIPGPKSSSDPASGFPNWE
jgi:hypothetical protein